MDTPAPASNLLGVKNLRAAYPGRDGASTEVVRGVSFELGRERLGIVGESGSGKSQTGRAILGRNAPGAVVTAERLVMHRGREVEQLDAADLAAHRVQAETTRSLMQASLGFHRRAAAAI
jgi:ABC-type glutathione transport system ATPase component